MLLWENVLFAFLCTQEELKEVQMTTTINCWPVGSIPLKSAWAPVMKERGQRRQNCARQAPASLLHLAAQAKGFHLGSMAFEWSRETSWNWLQIVHICLFFWSKELKFLLDSQRGSYLPKDCHCCRRRAVCWGELRASGQDARVPVPFLPLNSLFLCSSWGFFFSTYEKVIVIFPVPTTWGAEERKYVKTQWEVQREFILSHKMVIDLQLLVVCG